MCVVRNGQSCRPRKAVVLCGLGPSHNLGIFNNNVDSVLCALTERFFFIQIGSTYVPALHVSRNQYKKPLLNDFRKMVISNVGRVRKYSKSEVVQMYEGPKRRLYHEAQLSLEHKPLSKDDATVHQFGKFEKIDISKALRNINPRSQRYNLCLGQYLKKIEKRIFDAINAAYGGRTKATVIKGFNADVSAQILKDKWNQFKNPVAIGLDAKKFDAHVSREALQYEHAFYTGLFPGSKDLKELLKWQLVNNGVAYTEDGKVLFKMNGKRMSGDLNTSLGNCIIMCSLIWVLCKKLNIDCELANNGDDCVLFIESDHLITLQSYIPNFFKTHGFRMTVETPVYQFEELEFCQTKPVKLSTGWRMVRNHKAVLTKDPMCLIPVPNDKTLRSGCMPWEWGERTWLPVYQYNKPFMKYFYVMASNAPMECLNTFTRILPCSHAYQISNSQRSRQRPA